MCLFKKSAEKRYLSSSAKKRKLERKLETGTFSKRQEKRIIEKLDKVKDKKFIALTQLKHPTPKTNKKTSYSSKISIKRTYKPKSVNIHGHFHNHNDD